MFDAKQLEDYYDAVDLLSPEYPIYYVITDFIATTYADISYLAATDNELQVTRFYQPCSGRIVTRVHRVTR